MAPSVCRVADPIVSPTSGPSPLTVDIFTTAPSATALYVARDGTTPSCSTAAGTLYQGSGASIQVFNGGDIKVVACGSGSVGHSNVVTASITIVGTPRFVLNHSELLRSPLRLCPPAVQLMMRRMCF